MDNKKVIRKTIRADAWKLYKEGKFIEEIVDMLDAKFCHIHKLVIRWNGTKRMDEIKEVRKIYSVEPEQDEHKNILFKISQVKNFSNQFCLHTQNEKVKEAYHKMLTNRNSDIKP